MRAITPTPLTITATDVAEPGPGETVFVSGETVAVNAERIVVTTHRKYACLVAGTHTVSPNLDPVNWKNIGPTNAYALIDTMQNTGTTNALSMEVSVQPGERVDSVAVIAAEGDTLLLEMTTPALGVVWSKTASLTSRNTRRWYEYFFGTFGAFGSRIYFDVPPYSDATFTLTLTRSTGNVSCQAFIVGGQIYLGKMLTQASSDALNFAVIERDPFGTLSTLIPRRSVPTTDQTLIVGAQATDGIRAFREAANATPAVYSGLDDHSYNPMFEALLTIAIPRQFKLTFLNDNDVQVSLSLETI